MSKNALTDQKRKDFALAAIATLAAIRAEDSNAILNSKLPHTAGDTDGAFVGLVSAIVQLAQ